MKQTIISLLVLASTALNSFSQSAFNHTALVQFKFPSGGRIADAVLTRTNDAAYGDVLLVFTDDVDYTGAGLYELTHAVKGNPGEDGKYWFIPGFGLDSTNIIIAADQSVSSSTTLTAVTGLSFYAGTNTTWSYVAEFQIDTSSALSGAKVGMSLPSSPANSWYNATSLSSAGAPLLGTGATLTIALGLSGSYLVHIAGTIETGASTAGLVQPTFAQNASVGGAVTVKRGGYMRAWQVK